MRAALLAIVLAVAAVFPAAALDVEVYRHMPIERYSAGRRRGRESKKARKKREKRERRKARRDAYYKRKRERKEKFERDNPKRKRRRMHVSESSSYRKSVDRGDRAPERPDWRRYTRREFEAATNKYYQDLAKYQQRQREKRETEARETAAFIAPRATPPVSAAPPVAAAPTIAQELSRFAAASPPPPSEPPKTLQQAMAVADADAAAYERGRRADEARKRNAGNPMNAAMRTTAAERKAAQDAMKAEQARRREIRRAKARRAKREAERKAAEARAAEAAQRAATAAAQRAAAADVNEQMNLGGRRTGNASESSRRSASRQLQNSLNYAAEAQAVQTRANAVDSNEMTGTDLGGRASSPPPSTRPDYGNLDYRQAAQERSEAQRLKSLQDSLSYARTQRQKANMRLYVNEHGIQGAPAFEDDENLNLGDRQAQSLLDRISGTPPPRTHRGAAAMRRANRDRSRANNQGVKDAIKSATTWDWRARSGNELQKIREASAARRAERERQAAQTRANTIDYNEMIGGALGGYSATAQRAADADADVNEEFSLGGRRTTPAAGYATETYPDPTGDVYPAVDWSLSERIRAHTPDANEDLMARGFSGNDNQRHLAIQSLIRTHTPDANEDLMARGFSGDDPYNALHYASLIRAHTPDANEDLMARGYGVSNDDPYLSYLAQQARLRAHRPETNELAGFDMGSGTQLTNIAKRDALEYRARKAEEARAAEFVRELTGGAPIYEPTNPTIARLTNPSFDGMNPLGPTVATAYDHPNAIESAYGADGPPTLKLNLSANQEGWLREGLGNLILRDIDTDVQNRGELLLEWERQQAAAHTGLNRETATPEEIRRGIAGVLAQQPSTEAMWRANPVTGLATQIVEDPLEVALPFYGVAKNWNDLHPAERAGYITIDALGTAIPVLKGAKVAMLGGKTSDIRHTAALGIAPWRGITNPAQAARIFGQEAKNLASVTFNPNNFAQAYFTARPGTRKILAYEKDAMGHPTMQMRDKHVLAQARDGSGLTYVSQSDDFNRGALFGDSGNVVARDLGSDVTHGRKSALGVAETEDGKVALIESTYREGESLPGGLIEEGQTPAEAAMREVAEETGLDFTPDAQVFPMSGQHPIHAFTGKVTGGQIKPQASEVKSVSLVDPNNVKPKDLGSYIDLEALRAHNARKSVNPHEATQSDAPLLEVFSGDGVPPDTVDLARTPMGNVHQGGGLMHGSPRTLPNPLPVIRHIVGDEAKARAREMEAARAQAAGFGDDVGAWRAANPTQADYIDKIADRDFGFYNAPNEIAGNYTGAGSHTGGWPGQSSITEHDIERHADNFGSPEKFSGANLETEGTGGTKKSEFWGERTEQGWYNDPELGWSKNTAFADETRVAQAAKAKADEFAAQAAAAAKSGSPDADALRNQAIAAKMYADKMASKAKGASANLQAPVDKVVYSAETPHTLPEKLLSKVQGLRNTGSLIFSEDYTRGYKINKSGLAAKDSVNQGEFTTFDEFARMHPDVVADPQNAAVVESLRQRSAGATQTHRSGISPHEATRPDMSIEAADKDAVQTSRRERLDQQGAEVEAFDRDTPAPAGQTVNKVVNPHQATAREADDLAASARRQSTDDKFDADNAAKIAYAQQRAADASAFSTYARTGRLALNPHEATAAGVETSNSTPSVTRFNVLDDPVINPFEETRPGQIEPRPVTDDALSASAEPVVNPHEETRSTPPVSNNATRAFGGNPHEETHPGPSPSRPPPTVTPSRPPPTVTPSRPPPTVTPSRPPPPVKPSLPPAPVKPSLPPPPVKPSLPPPPVKPSLPPPPVKPSLPPPPVKPSLPPPPVKPSLPPPPVKPSLPPPPVKPSLPPPPVKPSLPPPPVKPSLPPPPVKPSLPPPPVKPSLPPPPVKPSLPGKPPPSEPPPSRPEKRRSISKTYPRTVQWKIGSLQFTRDLLTGRQRVVVTDDIHTGRPADSFKVITVSDVPPRRHRIDMGEIDAIVDGQGLRFVRDDNAAVRQRRVPQRNTYGRRRSRAI